MKPSLRKQYVGKEFSVLDHGFVQLVDVMGDDGAIVSAARTSVHNVKTSRDTRGLINYLMRNMHTSPFEMVEFKFLCKMPIFVARQWVRHRTASINEQSARYGVMDDEFYMPEQWRVQSKNNKQGSSEEVVDQFYTGRIQTRAQEIRKEAYDHYQNQLNIGVAREEARIDLPLSLYTKWVWKIDLLNLFRFLKLRMDSHAQYEIRVYANAMAEIVRAFVPIAWDAFEEHWLYAKTLSRSDYDALKKFAVTGSLPAEAMRILGMPLAT